MSINDKIDISKTAVWVAKFRASETLRKNAMFKDDYASRLIEPWEDEMTVGFKKIQEHLEWSVLSRTVIIDEVLSRTVKYNIDAIINLGAGLDTRPYRLDLPQNLCWYEIDLPHVIRFKEEKLSDCVPVCKLDRIGMNFENPAERKKVFADISNKNKNILLLTEGVIPYLTAAQVNTIATELYENKKIKFWILEYFSPQVYPYLKMATGNASNLKFKFSFFPEDWVKFFSMNGWKLNEISYSYQVAEKFNRIPNMALLSKILLPFTSKKKKEAAKKVSGMMLLSRNKIQNSTKLR